MRPGRWRRLIRFVYRERRLIGARRPQLGVRRAVGERLRATFELAGDDELAALRVAAEAHSQAVTPIPDMGRALEGLAARIDALDTVTEGLGAPAAEVVSPAPVPIPVPPARPRPRPEFPKHEGHLRILVMTDMYPLISETYIREEVHSLARFGVDIAFYRRLRGPSQMAIPEPVFDDLDEALEVVRPHLALVYWLTTADYLLPSFERHGLPFGLRAHSFDFDRSLMSRLLEHPLCAGGWTYPAEDFHVPGAHTLAPIFDSADLLGHPATVRDAIVSVSAGLPKKDWPLLLDAFDQIEGGDRRLIVGTTIDFEDNPSHLLRACEALGNPPLVQVNLTRPQVLHLLGAHTAACIYTLTPEARFGMPMSIVDALCAGCSVIVPDRPEALAFAGPDARPYRSAGDIARHAAEIRAGGTEIEAEWARNRAYGLARFADQAAPARFMAELRADIERVLGNRPGG